jgi:NADPH:quinone reductase-like Zn-dependent oxidoreductase
MRAVRQAGWGGREQLSVCDGVPIPSPVEGQVLVRVRAASINAADRHMLSGRPYLIRAAVGLAAIPGMDFAGVVEGLGEGVKTLALGDEILGTADVKAGAFAQFVCVPEGNVTRKPAHVDWETAAAVATAGQTAMQALRAGRLVEKGDHVLVYGASGGVGTFAVQLAKLAGARVTAACSGRNVLLARELGADDVVDYTTHDIATSGGAKYDKIIDTVGRPRWRPLLKPRGVSVAVALPYPESECVPCVLCSILCAPFCCCCLSTKKSLPFMQEVKSGDLEMLAKMLGEGEGKIRAVVGRRVESLEELLDALATPHAIPSGSDHPHGKTVVTMGAFAEVEVEAGGGTRA